MAPAVMILAMLIAPAVVPQTPPVPPLAPGLEPERQWSGTVTSVPPPAGVFRMRTGTGEDVEVIAGTRFNPGWSLEDLQPGLLVVVTGVLEPGGAIRARFITVVADPPAPHSQ
jgi:hypothetical protein